MSSDAINESVHPIEESADSRPSAIEFEMAYQARVAIDRIRFAIKHTEQFGPRSDQMREAGLQLLDALQRLETVDRCFQARHEAGDRVLPHPELVWRSMAKKKEPSVRQPLICHRFLRASRPR